MPVDGWPAMSLSISTSAIPRSVSSTGGTQAAASILADAYSENAVIGTELSGRYEFGVCHLQEERVGAAVAHVRRLLGQKTLDWASRIPHPACRIPTTIELSVERVVTVPRRSVCRLTCRHETTANVPGSAADS